MHIVFNKAWIEFAIVQKTSASFPSSKIMANKLLFCFQCLIFRLGEAQVTMIIATRVATVKKNLWFRASFHFCS